jgi:FAD/FMN-containing dehydrogenase
MAVLPEGDWVGDNTIEIAALERIYEVVAAANHNYAGHRGAAMGAISRAARALGGSVEGQIGKGDENQALSDQQLRFGLTLLGQVRDSFAAEDPKNVLNDLRVAVNQLGAALSVN